jgi:hypothetical protein
MLPDSNNVQRKFSEKEAQDIAIIYAKSFAKEGYHINVINGPRTGKYKDDNSEDTNAHTSEEDISVPTDKISKAFLDKLKEDDFKDFNFFDFRKGKPSMFTPLMKEAKLVLVPGESPSFISEVNNNAAMIIYETGSMNDSHYTTIRTMGFPFNEWVEKTSEKSSAAMVAQAIERTLSAQSQSMQR